MELKEKTLIIGVGEIGKSLGSVLSVAYDVHFKDIKDEVEGEFPVINVCYPYSKKFIEITNGYIKRYNPELVLIHSTVPVGTTRKIGKLAVHSPVNGRHPNLQESILAFTKFIAGTSAPEVMLANVFLRRAGIKTMLFSSPEATELAKISCTSIQYALDLIKAKEINRLCDKYGVPFHEVYTAWNSVYNEGYDKLGEKRFHRTNLYPMSGGIGGHCVMANCELLDDDITKFVKERNKLYNKIDGRNKTG